MSRTRTPRGGRDAKRRGHPGESLPQSVSAARPLAPVELLVLFGFFLGLGLFIYGPALDGEFISDDQHYVRDNPYVHDPSPENLIEILKPAGIVAAVVENYAPVHVLLHTLEWQFFQEKTRGYHVVNIVFHALASLLLVLLFQRSGLPPPLAVFGGLCFLVHPANAEAVAWISQLKTSSALVLTVGALFAHPRRPLLGALLFALALLAKPTAAVGLFAVVGFGLVRPGVPWRWGWIVAWAGIFAAFAVAELAAFADTAGRAPPIYPDLDVRVRTIVAIALRYLVMATTSLGLSTFHETPAAESLLDPWFLAALAVLGLLGSRLFIVARERREEAVYWLWVLVSFAPICGVIPLPFPMADRYLYFMLPGLIGAGLLAVQPRLALAQPSVRNGAGALAVLVLLGFAVRTYDRASVWETPFGFMTDAELHYPDGAAAKTRQARRAALSGDVQGAVDALNAARARGYNRLDHLLHDPAYAEAMNDPAFHAMIVEMANEWLQRLGENEDPSQMELRLIAQAYIVVGDMEAALRASERALEVGGPLDDRVREDLEELHRHFRLRR